MLKTQPFSLSVDRSNDAGLKKMNPLAVKYFDIDGQRVVLDMCTTTGESAATAASIVVAINRQIE